MVLPHIDPTTTLAWKKLQAHFDQISQKALQELFAADSNRAAQFQVQWQDFLLDYSKNQIDAQTLQLLVELAQETGLGQAMQSYFEGGLINQTEGRAVLHTALRLPESASLMVDGQDIVLQVQQVKQQIKDFSDQVISGAKKGFSGKPFTDVVNIGIGGSDLGPAMVCEALAFYGNHLQVHFVSNIDGDPIAELLGKLNPETTLFVIVSKTFTTQETLTNATTIRKWFLKSASQQAVAKHFVAVSSNVDKATAFGIDPDAIFPMWDWVGGRFSLWSAVGLSISLALGYGHFEQLLSGAHQMDGHFRTAPYQQNMPVLLALIGIWHNNFFAAQTEAVIPYAQQLQKLAAYLQQGIMESNGKQTSREGKRVDYQTGTVIWGEPGTNAQHAFFQLMHQGTKQIPADFIGFVRPLYEDQGHHDKLMSNFFAQTEALLMGKTEATVKDELRKAGYTAAQIEALAPYKIFEGNKPTNTILIDQLTPAALGKLIALYEHKIFVQGIIWNIFSYDQWGVELGKELANSIIDEIQNGQVNAHDSSTTSLLKYFLQKKA